MRREVFNKLSMYVLLRRRATWLVLAVFLSTACVHSARPPKVGLVNEVNESAGAEIEILDLSWDDLLSSTSSEFTANPALPLDDMILTSERLAALPLPLQRDLRLARLALARSLENPSLFDLGVLGMVGTSRLFVTTSDKIKNYERLYWTMVQVLSRKYGCFIRTKLRTGDETKVTCKDKRTIVFWRSQGAGWIQFFSRQFDKEGYEIMVKKRRIVRISNERII
jgi:hypothetical protein